MQILCNIFKIEVQYLFRMNIYYIKYTYLKVLNSIFIKRVIFQVQIIKTYFYNLKYNYVFSHVQKSTVDIYIYR